MKATQIDKRHSSDVKWRAPPSYFLNKLHFTSYVCVIIIQCVISCESVLSRLISANAISGVNGYNLQVIVIVGCRVGVSAVVVAVRGYPHRDTSRKPWCGSVSIEVTDNSSAIFA